MNELNEQALLGITTSSSQLKQHTTAFKWKIPVESYLNLKFHADRDPISLRRSFEKLQNGLKTLNRAYILT